jgi:Tol biopolymer transport system component
MLALPPLISAADPVTEETEIKSAEPRRLAVDDYFRLREVADPRISPDGGWIAYKVTTTDLKEDESRDRLWMVPTTGGRPVPLTVEESSSSSRPRPRWSPDGKYLAFLSARGEGKTQVWTLFRQGGDAVQLTDTPQAVKAFEWSPDSKRMVIVLQDPTPQELEEKERADNGKKKEEETPPPWVVDRRQFKQDYTGYLDRRRTHLYVLDVESKKLTQITAGDFDDTEPVWAPGGERVAFVSNRTADPDANYNTDIWVVTADDPDLGEPLLQITTNGGPDRAPAWSPDGSSIAHISATDTDAIVYATNHLAISPSRGGEARVLTEELDRMTSRPRFSADGRSIYFILEDSESSLARTPSTPSTWERTTPWRP